MWYVQGELGSMEKKLEYSNTAVEQNQTSMDGITQEKQLKHPNCANLWFERAPLPALLKTEKEHCWYNISKLCG